MVSAQSVLQEGLASLFTSKDFADFTITCGPQTFKVHKAVIGAQSEYFRIACRRGFTEGDNGAIDLKTSDSDPTCDDPEAVKHMVHFFYHLNYNAEATIIEHDPAGELEQAYFDETPAEEASLDGDILTHAKVFAIAVKYQIPGLRQLAAEKFKRTVEVNASCSDFARVIQVVYTTTAENVRDLRDVIVDILDSETALCDDKAIGEVVRSIEGLSWELFRKSKGRPAGLIEDGVVSFPYTKQRKKHGRAYRMKTGIAWDANGPYL